MKKYFIILIYFYIQLNYSISSKSKIAIIGAGIGGTSCALYLKDLIGNKAEIYIYEHKEIGGRLASIEDNGQIYEIGGQGFSDYDKLVSEIYKRLNLKQIKNFRKLFTIYEDQKLIPRTIWKLLQDFPSNFKAAMFVDQTIKKFDTIYKNLDKKKTYTSVISMINKTGMRPLITKNVNDCLKEYNVSESVMNLYKAHITSIFGYFDTMPGLAAHIPVRHPKFSIQGGNKKIAEECLKKSGAKLYKEKVVKLMREDYVKCRVISIKNDTEEPQVRDFDFVVIATPLGKDLTDDIEFENYDTPPSLLINDTFKPKITTILEGQLKSEFFGENQKIAEKTKHIKFTDTVNSINHVSKIRKNLDIWRIQSDKFLPDGDIQDLFDVKRMLSVTKSIGYPNYQNHHMLIQHEKFLLADNLFYINCIEWAASSVEMSLIGSKNVALLIYKLGKFENPNNFSNL